MRKLILITVSTVLIILAVSVIFLSIYGVRTDNFNAFINSKVKEYNSRLTLKLNNTFIKLNLTQGSINISTKNATLLGDNNSIKILSVDINLNVLKFLKKEKENQNNEAIKSDIGWGHQIRSYVLQPYKLVKDNRTNFESSSPEKVLDGEIDDFLENSLYQIK